MDTGSESLNVYNSILKELIRHGFPKHRAMKALICSGYAGFDAAFQWLHSHSNDPTLDDISDREFILYLIPSGELQNQISKFYEACLEECGWSGMHNFIPHISLTPYFKVPSLTVPLLIQTVKDIKLKNKNFCQLLQNIPLELYASHNFIGLYITKSSVPVITNFLKDIKLNMDLHSELKGHSFKESEKKFHLSLAYHFATEKYSKLCSLVNTLINPNSPCKWELQLYSRDKYFAEYQVYKVVHCFLPKRPRELELKLGDFIYVKEGSQSPDGDGVKGTSWLTGVSGILKTNLIKRTAVSDTWTSYLSCGQNLSTSPQPTVSPVKSAENESEMKNIYIMRHGERIDFTFSKNWLPSSLDQKGLGLNNSIPICIEPGLFEWTAWYTECFPSWLSPKELSDYGFFINTAYSPIIQYEHLYEMPESLEWYYNRSFDVMKSIIDKTDLRDHDMSNNNSVPSKPELCEEIDKEKESDFNKERGLETHDISSKVDEPELIEEILNQKRSDFMKENVDSSVKSEKKKVEFDYCPSVKKEFIPKKRKKYEEFRKKTKTRSYFKTRLKKKPMSGSEIEAVMLQPDSQNDNGLLSRKQMSKESTFDSLASTSKALSPTIDKEHVSETLPPEEVTMSSSKFGFIGLGRMGSSIVRNLLNSGHIVYIWNRTIEKCFEFEDHEGAEILSSPAEVVSAADITFCCLSDKDAARQVVFGNSGVLGGMRENKGYVEMSGVDSETSNDIAETIVSLGGRYLEVRLQGSFKDAQEGSLIIVAAGDRLLYDECSTCFYVCGKQSFFLGEEVGSASNMNLVVRLMFGVSLAAVAEGMALADRCGLNTSDLIEILKLSPLNNSFMISKCMSIAEKNFEPDLTLNHLQKDMNMALELSSSCEQNLFVSANANELLKFSKRLGCKNLDASAIFRAMK